jgi:hypothetical protein
LLDHQHVAYDYKFECQGYGHITPKSEVGQLVTIVYALIGIPLNFITLANIGSVMATAFRFLYKNVFCKRCLQYHDEFTIAGAMRRMNDKIRKSYGSARSKV